MNELSLRLFKDTYFTQNEDFDSWVNRMTINRIGHNGYDMTNKFTHMEEILPRVREYISKRWFQPATPISANLGTERGMPISCFVREVADSRDSIFYSFNEGFWLGSEGTGIGTDWSLVRSIGEPIKNGIKGTTSGVIPFMKLSDSAALAISQGSTRRSSEAVYLDVSHPEIEEFINFRKQSNNTDINRYCPNLHHCVKVSNEFMEAVKSRSKWKLKSPMTGEVAKEIDAFSLWISILDVRSRFQGEPYIFFTDNVNSKNKAELYKEIGVPVNMSNLCVAGDTQILTKQGYKEIESLANCEVELWNGKRWSKSLVKQTSNKSKVLKVSLSNGQVIEATPYHKWYIAKQDHRGKLLNYIETRTNELKVGDKLHKLNLSVCDHGSKELHLAYENGFYTGDGTKYSSNKQLIYLYHDKKELLEYFNSYLSCRETATRLELKYSDLKEKFFIPDVSYSIQSRLEWLSGLLDADGCVVKTDDTYMLQLASINKDFLRELQLMLQELGVDSKVVKQHPARKGLFPNGKGGVDYYDCKETDRIIITASNYWELIDLGLNCHRLEKPIKQPNREASQFVKVVSILDDGTEVPTYCANEPLEHKIVLNGVITGNCTEISLHTSPTKSNICCLGSINLAKLDEFGNNLSEVVSDCLFYLDWVVECFITRAEGKPQYIRALKGAIEDRPLGLGVMGYHTFLQQKRVPFESDEAKEINTDIFSAFNKAKELYERKCKELQLPRCELASKNVGTYHRNATHFAIAPTMSISNLCNQVSQGIEPIMSNFYSKKLKQGTFLIKNIELEKVLKTKGLSDAELRRVWDSIRDNLGSVQHLDCLTNREKDLFKTAFEISQFEIIKQAAERQKYIDQAQSINLFFTSKSPPKEIYDVHMLAWELGVKTLYYQRSLAEARVVNTNERKTIAVKACSIDNPDCESCQ